LFYDGRKRVPRYSWSVVVVALTVALSVGVATASAGEGGNSANAKLCQKNGWTTLVRSDGSSFANQSECVSYGAHGNTLVPKTKSQLDCESFSGVYSTDPADDLSGITGLPGGTFVWSCNGVTLPISEFFSTLTSDCIADTNGLFVFGNANQSRNYSCFGF
jgi:hypothetical protein